MNSRMHLYIPLTFSFLLIFMEITAKIILIVCDIVEERRKKEHRFFCNVQNDQNLLESSTFSSNFMHLRTLKSEFK